MMFHDSTPNSKTFTQGFSLFELLVVLAILTIAYCLVMPNLNGFLVQQEAALALDQLQAAIALARNSAFQRGKIITLCGSRDKHSCHLEEDWSSGFIIFENEFKEKQPKTPQHILQIFPGQKFGKLIYSNVGQLLHIEPTGMTMSIGSFTYSPKRYTDKSDKIESKTLVINRACRCYKK